MNIYVGNLPYSTSEDDLRNMFSAYGEVSTTSVVKDRETGRSRGFGFVTMESDNEGQSAIEAMHGTEMGGRALVVNEARPRTEGGNNFRGGSRGGNRSRY